MNVQTYTFTILEICARHLSVMTLNLTDEFSRHTLTLNIDIDTDTNIKRHIEYADTDSKLNLKCDDTDTEIHIKCSVTDTDMYCISSVLKLTAIYKNFLCCWFEKVALCTLH